MTCWPLPIGRCKIATDGKRTSRTGRLSKLVPLNQMRFLVISTTP